MVFDLKSGRALSLEREASATAWLCDVLSALRSVDRYVVVPTAAYVPGLYMA